MTKIHKVLFVQSGGQDGKVKPLVENQGKSLEQIGVDVSYFSISSGIVNYVRAIFKLHLKAKEERYDLIHAHFGLCGVVSLLSFPKIPIIVSFMGDDILGSIKNGKYTFFSRVVSFINKFLGRFCYSYIIVKSAEMQNRLFSRTPSSVLPNGVDLNSFDYIDKVVARRKLKWDNNKNYIIFCSDPKRPEKNYDLAVKACKLCRRKKIILVPVFNVPNSEMKCFYSAADCLVLPSLHEGSPNVIKESMACNCPIVATDVGDVSWIIKDVEGCFISSFYVEEFSIKLNQAINFAEKNNRTKGRKKIIDLGLASADIANQLVKLYSELIKVS